MASQVVVVLGAAWVAVAGFGAVGVGAVGEQGGVERDVAIGRCLACHAASPGTDERLAALPSPRLSGLGERVGGDWLRGFLAGHFPGRAGRERAADVAAALLGPAPAIESRQPVRVSSAVIEQGGALFRELGCRACHAADGVPDIAAKTDLRGLTAFLTDARATRPDLPFHDFALEPGEAERLGAWLLRARRADASSAPPTPGFAVECFELHIADPGLPDLDGLQPSAVGHTDTVDVEMRTRDDHFALRFSAMLDAPVDGEYRFRLGSDDSSWLWLDGDLVIRNEAIAPFRTRDARVRLTAGKHDLLIVFTEAGGGQRLELDWQPPGASLGPVPPDRVFAQADALLPLAPGSLPRDGESIARGRAAIAAARCASCHAGDDLPVPDPAPAWAALRADRDCPSVPVTPAHRRALARRGTPTGPQAPRDRLAAELRELRCLDCHDRGGAGGMRDDARRELTETEDLGEEGRAPPSLDRAGHRLRRTWIEAVLAEGRDARPYVRARCARLSAERAAELAGLFAAVDSVPGDDVEPPFSAAAVREGQRTVAVGGFSCVICHRAMGRPSLGPQGMDLAIQFERLKPGWFRQWLLQPATLRPGTRMPQFWAQPTPAAIAQVDAVRAWTSLGAAAPIPAGVANPPGSFRLEVSPDRPRLHGAFLDGLSAHCIAVGTPERVHFAYDLAHARLAWLWRGEFLDAEGTWSGRAGRLLKPAGDDWIVLPDARLEAPGRTVAIRTLGWRLDAEGYPTFRIAVADGLVLEDAPRPRFGDRQIELVRRLTARGGDLRIELPTTPGLSTLVGAAPQTAIELRDGRAVEVVYRW
ncbi:MAG: hypothetical protein IPM29_09185 [Planctomycetes bacterium]|nr:hypothetical protein [Planctomycetota bacterium]